MFGSRLQRFEKTNEMLSNCNTLSATRLERAMRDFKGHTAQILDMKKDLDHVLKRIHNLKQKLMKENPDAFKGMSMILCLPIDCICNQFSFLFLAIGASMGPVKEEDDEYDEMIKARKAREKEELERQKSQS